MPFIVKKRNEGHGRSVTTIAQPQSSHSLIELLCCPRCAGGLHDDGTLFRCSTCAQVYPVTDGIPQLYVPIESTQGQLDVTDVVKEFYEATPFPNYDDLDSRDSLQTKARRGIFANLLDKQLPPNALVLDAGCGTGQLTNFLGMNWQRRVIGADLCMNSLRLANEFRNKFVIVNAGFLQMNLFRPPFEDGSFDIIVSNGVLHHTGDPAGAFRSLAAKLKPGGIFIVGLYNKLGRLPTLWRRRMIEMFGDRMSMLDGRLRGKELNRGRWAAWFRDQYKHPHESRHSMDEVLQWFDAVGFEFLSSIPAIGGADIDKNWQLFKVHSAGTSFDRISTELGMLLSGGTDGGLFIMIGRKRPIAGMN
jgi:SAM-dependent methyltransferase